MDALLRESRWRSTMDQIPGPDVQALWVAHKSLRWQAADPSISRSDLGQFGQ